MFAIYLQWLKKLVSDAVNFLHEDKHESFLQIDIMIFDWNGQASQNNKFAMLLQYLKKSWR